MTPVDCFLSLGSNEGGAQARVRRGLRELARLPRTRLVAASRVCRSAPVGAPGQEDYRNAAARVRTDLSPMGLLAELKRVEARCGRRPGPRWGPRPLDIDILFYGHERLSTPWLELPHPRALSRRFVLAPLAELAPGWVPPVRPRRTVRQWLARLSPRGQMIQWVP